ncbi:hypothetical protein SOVF_146990, partial [Spinacia oleracea]
YTTIAVIQTPTTFSTRTALCLSKLGDLSRRIASQPKEDQQGVVRTEGC